MRVLVCGGRNFKERHGVFSALNELHATTVIDCIIHGHCSTGADRWADEWGQQHGVEVLRFPAGQPDRQRNRRARHQMQLLTDVLAKLAELGIEVKP